LTGKVVRQACYPLFVGFALVAALVIETSPAQARPTPRCLGKAATIVGTDGADVLRGTPRADVIVGRGGKDRIFGRGGDDRICGGRGNDELHGQRGDDILDGGAGTDSCYQGEGTGSKRLCEGPTFALTVSTSGDGGGTVSSSPTGIECSPDCVGEYPEGAEVSLTAMASANSWFAGWGGSCSGTGSCTVNMTGARSVNAHFNINELPLETPTSPAPLQAVLLAVVRAGNGGGNVTSFPAGVNCGPECSASFLPGTSLTLTGTPDTGSLLSGWSGCDSTFANVCMVTPSASTTLTATFMKAYELTVSKSGAGTGQVSSSPPGINCAWDCIHDYADGTLVVLTAAPDTGSAVDSWSGCNSALLNTCTVTMNSSRNVTASFKQAWRLTVNKTGAGSGTVVSLPEGIDCGSDCTEVYTEGILVTLTATAGASAIFSGWSGSGCSGTGTCIVTMSATRSVTATFTQAFTLTVTTNGAGTVTSTPSGIKCGVDCSESYAEDTVVTLTATPDLLHVFLGWGGSCSGILVPTCLVTMNAARSATATFL
jgi:hypothetical protein